MPWHIFVAILGLRSPANTRRWSEAGLMLVQRRRRWSSIKPASLQRLVHIGTTLLPTSRPTDAGHAARSTTGLKRMLSSKGSVNPAFAPFDSLQIGWLFMDKATCCLLTACLVNTKAPPPRRPFTFCCLLCITVTVQHCLRVFQFEIIINVLSAFSASIESHQTQDSDAGPTDQHWFKVLCLLR